MSRAVFRSRLGTRTAKACGNAYACQTSAFYASMLPQKRLAAPGEVSVMRDDGLLLSSTSADGLPAASPALASPQSLPHPSPSTQHNSAPNLATRVMGPR
eukprot:139830-Chlamydomonas_euryale.AAC.1